ncbi:MaoC family dehydratase [Thermoleophilia bacterium SCSIO 60948]|nr:MaoC family dehydratase [Thermoleophilia bacterium SCSIO 60948]
MEKRVVDGVDGLKQLVGEKLGPSDPIVVDQARIDAYADVCGDHQWIHCDPERAANESPFGKTIAHGNLTLSLIEGFRLELLEQRGFKMGINYGFDKVRYPAPVPVDSKVVATIEVASVDELDGGWYHVVSNFDIRVEGAEKPSVVAQSVTRMLAD